RHMRPGAELRAPAVAVDLLQAHEQPVDRLAAPVVLSLLSPGRTRRRRTRRARWQLIDDVADGFHCGALLVLSAGPAPGCAGCGRGSWQGCAVVAASSAAPAPRLRVAGRR